MVAVNKDPDELQEGEYIPFEAYGKPGRTIGFIFLCPGCGVPIAVGEEAGKNWRVDPDKVTVSPSIVHDVAKGGCGWHGYLENGVFRTA